MQNWNIATWEERRIHKGFLGTQPEAVHPEDEHRRTADDIEADRLIEARRTLLLRFLPFVLLEDQNLPPAELLEKVAGRLFDEARAIRKTMYGGATATYQGVGNVPDETADHEFNVRRDKGEPTHQPWSGY